MKSQKYEVGGKLFRFSLSLAQDEILAPIVRSILTECPGALTSATRSMLDASKQVAGSKDPKNDERIRQLENQLVSMALDMAQVNAFVYEKRYTRRILAVLLVPSAGEFDENDIPEREEFMAKHASREVALEVLNTFFSRSGIFGLATAASSQKVPATKKAQ